MLHVNVKQMCIIIIKQRNNVVPMGTLKTCARINPHGLGIVWLDTFEVTKQKSKDYKQLHTDRPFIAHFRLATVGLVNKSNIHPFVCGQKSHELLMMNGTIPSLGNLTNCDTKVLARSLGNIPRENWKLHLERHDCRFVTINRHSRTWQMYNRESWIKQDGVWYSKGNVLRNNYVAVYGTLKKNCGNHHLLSDSTFISKGITKDKYPMVVRGIPYVIEDRGKGYYINVEVYQVSNDTLSMLDRLERHPDWYERKEIEIHAGGRVYTCWLYFNNTIKYDGEMLVDNFERDINYYINNY